MSLIGVNVIFGLDTDFSSQANASDSKTRWIDTKEIVSITQITTNEGTPGSAIILNNGISPYGIECRITQSPTALTASDTF